MKTKKVLSLILIFTLIFGICSLGANAGSSSYPESEHNYPNDSLYEWYYEYPEQVEGLYVTFSEESSLEAPSISDNILSSDVYDVISSIIESGNIEYLENLISTSMFQMNVKIGDYITLYNEDESYYRSFTSSDFGGKTVYIEGNSFFVKMKTDSSVTDYGFSFDRIDPTPPEGVEFVTLTFCDKCNYSVKHLVNPGEKIILDFPSAAPHNDDSCPNTDMAFVCFVDENGKEYNIGDSVDFSSTALTAKYIPLLLGKDEVFSFANTEEDFLISDSQQYYMHSSDKRAMLSNLKDTFPVIFSTPLAVAYLTYPYWEWKGSCYGMAAAAFLQHYGVIDMLEGQDADCVRELENNEDIISTINYYQYAAAGSFLSESFGLNPGSEMYSLQLKRLYETVESGNIVLFSYFPNGIIEDSTGHTVLLTGAYTMADGTHVLIEYDNNYPGDYYGGYTHRYYISPDFTTIEHKTIDGHDLNPVGEFNWTADYTHFEAFDIEGNGNPDTLYDYFFAQIKDYLKIAVDFLLKALKK